MQNPHEHMPKNKAGERCVLNGIAVSSGITIGRTQFLNRSFGGPKACCRNIAPHEVDTELEKLKKAVASIIQEFHEAKLQLQQIASSPREQLDMLDVYILICNDNKLLNAAIQNIKEKLVCAEWAWKTAEDAVVASFEKMDSVYLRERAADVRTIGLRVISRLNGQQNNFRLSAEKQIILAHDLTPADTMNLAPDSIMALATEMGGQTSHTGILARSMNIPCIVGVSGLQELAPDNALVIVDGISGLLIINPTESELLEYNSLQEQYEIYQARIKADSWLPAETHDAIRIGVHGNIETSPEVTLVKSLGGEGIGLFRTEFGYMSRRTLPTEEELYTSYAEAVGSMAPGPVVLRTLDVGADKSIGGNEALEEQNPALGLRAIRYCLRHQSIFRRQLKAILRASAHGNAAVMFPMISGLTELRAAKSILGEVRQELDSENIAYDKNIQIGTMIELPSAVFQASVLAKEVDFFSIGTNDLIQYTLGIDRGNKYVSYLYQPLHPAIIQALRLVVDAAKEAGISVCVCGEVASDPYCLPILLGMGVDTLSINPQSIPAVKHLVRNFDMEDLRGLLREVYNSGSAHTTSRLVSQYIYSILGTELKFFNSATGRSA